MMKNMLNTIERKIEEEVSMRQKDLVQMKASVEQKLVSLVDKLK